MYKDQSDQSSCVLPSLLLGTVQEPISQSGCPDVDWEGSGGPKARSDDHVNIRCHKWVGIYFDNITANKN